MARQKREKREAGESFLVSTFYLGETLIGIDTIHVQEITKVVQITRVPRAPEYIVGIINLRGRIVTVMDLGSKLEIDPLEIRTGSRIMIVGWQDEYVGLLVDRVAEVIPAEKQQIMQSPANVKGVQGKFFEGVYRYDDHLIAILDIDEVLMLGDA